MRDIMLSNHYAFDGMWWLPAESDRRYGGHLELSPARMTLTIFGDDPDFLMDFPYGEYATIHGIGTDGTPFTLLRVIPGGGTGRSASVHANLCLIGMHVATIEEPVAAEAYFNLTHLEEWFGQPIFSQGRRAAEDDQHLMTASCLKLGELVNCSIPSHDVNVSSFHAVNTHSTWFTDLHWSCRAYLCVSRENRYRPIEIVQVAHELSRLWTILSGIWFQEQQVRFVSPTDHSLVYFYYMTSPYQSDENRSVLTDMVFPFENLQEDVCTVMKAWWERSPALDAASILYYKVATRHHMEEYSILDIVDLVHAMDIFSSMRGNTKILHNSKGMLRAVRNAIKSQNLKPDVAKQFLEKLSYCNERSLRMKIISLADNLCSEARHAFDILEESNVLQIVHTRNYFAHFDPRLTKKMVSDADLFDVADKCRALVLFMLLSGLGLEEKRIVDRLLTSRPLGLVLRRS
jgi:ApeA N-terminal domain 1